MLQMTKRKTEDGRHCQDTLRWKNMLFYSSFLAPRRCEATGVVSQLYIILIIIIRYIQRNSQMRKVFFKLYIQLEINRPNCPTNYRHAYFSLRYTILCSLQLRGIFQRLKVLNWEVRPPSFVINYPKDQFLTFFFGECYYRSLVHRKGGIAQ